MKQVVFAGEDGQVLSIDRQSFVAGLIYQFTDEALLPRSVSELIEIGLSVSEIDELSDGAIVDWVEPEIESVVAIVEAIESIGATRGGSLTFTPTQPESSMVHVRGGQPAK
jgi:hypothetical protein